MSGFSLEPFQHRITYGNQLFLESFVSGQIVGIRSQDIAGCAGDLGKKALLAQGLDDMGAGADVEIGFLSDLPERDGFAPHIRYGD